MGGQQDVGGLDVSVDAVAFMKVHQGLDHLLQDEGNAPLVQLGTLIVQLRPEFGNPKPCSFLNAFDHPLEFCRHILPMTILSRPMVFIVQGPIPASPLLHPASTIMGIIGRHNVQVTWFVSPPSKSRTHT